MGRLKISNPERQHMHNIIYFVGLAVIVIVILRLVGFV